jgi:AAA family ATP:ADP antiporter
VAAFAERVRRGLDIEPGEERVLVVGAAALFLVEWASVSATNVAETFFLKRVGVDRLPMVFLANSLLLVGTSFLAARLAARVEQRRLLSATLLLFGMALLALRLMVAVRAPGVFALLVVFAKQTDAIAQLVFWTALGGLVTGRQAKRLFAPITAGGTLGTICGSFASGPLGRELGIPSLLVVAGVLLGVGALVTGGLRRRGAVRPRPAATVREPLGARRFQRLWDGWLFRVLVLSAFLGGVLGPVLYYQFSYVADLATKGSSGEQRLLELYAVVRGWINVGVLAIQLVGTSALFRTLGVPVASSLSPVIYLLGLLGLAARTSLAAGVGAMAGATLQDHAVYDPAQRILTTLFPERVRTAVATVVEGPVKRTGGVIGNIAVLGILAVGSPVWVGWFGVPIAGLWLLVSLLLWRRYPALLLEVASAERSEVPSSRSARSLLDAVTLRGLEQALVAPDVDRCRAACALVVEAAPRRAVAALARALAVAPLPNRSLLVTALDRVLEAGSVVDRSAARAVASVLATPDGLTALDGANLVQAYARLLGPRMADDERQLLERAAGDGGPIGLAARAALARLAGGADLDAVVVRAVTSPDAATRQIAREELRTELLGTKEDPASGAAAQALVALLDSPVDRAAAAGALADVAVHRGARMAPLAAAMLAQRDDADAAVRAAVLRFVGAVGLTAEASWVADRLAAREAVEGDAAMRALEGFGRAAVDVTWRTLCIGSLRARRRALAIVRKMPDDDLAHWWPSVHGEIDRGLALLVIAGTLPGATPSIVRRRLRERMDAHALAALFLLAALLDDARLVRAGEVLARAPGERARAVVLEVLDVVLPDEATGLLPLLEGGHAAADRARRLLGSRATTPEDALGALLDDGDRLTARLLAASALGGITDRLDGGAAPMSYDRPDPDMADEVDKILHLHAVDLFERLTTQQLADMAVVVDEVTVGNGAAIVTEGEFADCMYFIVDGRVRVTKASVFLREWGPGDYFGEMSVLDGETRSATATANGRVRLLRLDREALLRVMDDQPAIAIAICQTLSRRVRELLDDRTRPDRTNDRKTP